MPVEKKLCHTPTPNKQPVAIPLWKYEAVRRAILEVVPTSKPGIKAKDLPGLVRPVLSKQLTAEALKELGSVGWHTTSVKLNMEVEGELTRVEGQRPQHLVRCT